MEGSGSGFPCSAPTGMGRGSSHLLSAPPGTLNHPDLPLDFSWVSDGHVPPEAAVCLFSRSDVRTTGQPQCKAARESLPRDECSNSYYLERHCCFTVKFKATFKDEPRC